jgi:3-hydroxybutyryl-CoA dehydrogenase
VDLLKPDLVAAVVGAGTMGRGIAQVCAQAGLTTLMFDSRDGAVQEAIAGINKALDGLVTKGRMTAEVKQGVIDHLKPIGSLDEVASAGVVIEAIVENLDAKRELFRELEKRLAPDAVIATNTSSLSVTEIAAGCGKPERVAGLHFFNPPPLMKLVEVIGGLRTDPAVVEGLTGFGKRINKHPVVATDTPGFLVNHAGRAYGPEALRIVAQGIASPREVDLLMKEAAGFRMGPFELLDLVGGDVAHAVMVSIYDQYFGEPMYQPSAQMTVRVAGGLLGRKSKQGFYDYSGPPSAGVPTVAVPAAPAPASAWVADEDGGAELAEWMKAAGVKCQLGGAPDARAPCFVTPLGEDASGAAVRLKLDPARTVAVDMLGRFQGRRTLMKTPLTTPETLGAAVAALSAGNAPVTVINDSAGFVIQRLLCMIVNIGSRIAELRIAAPADIDTAVELGLNYPKGPLALGDSLGVARVLAVLDGMHAITLDPKYRASTWLRRRARLGVSLRTPD